MAGLFNNQNVQQVSQREQLSAKYHSARHNLLLVVVFTLVNIILLVTNSNTYFLFSASIPYLVVDLAMMLCGKYPAEYYEGDLAGMLVMSDGFFAVMLMIAGVILILYLLSWILTKKPSVGWMIFALVFFAIDTAGMLILIGISTDMILDIVFHGWVLVSLTNGILSYYKLKKLPVEEEEVPAMEESAQQADITEEN